MLTGVVQFSTDMRNSLSTCLKRAAAVAGHARCRICAHCKYVSAGIVLFRVNSLWQVQTNGKNWVLSQWQQEQLDCVRGRENAQKNGGEGGGDT